jgi:oligosaccharide repeat unit polymerase
MAFFYISICAFLYASLFVYVNIKSDFGYISIIFTAYWLLFFTLPAIYHITDGYYPFYNMTYPDEVVNYSSLIFLVFTTSIILGFIVWPRMKSIKHTSSELISLGGLYLFSLTSIVVQIIILALYGVDVFIRVRSDFSLEDFGKEYFAQIVIYSVRYLSFVNIALFSYIISIRMKLNAKFYVIFLVSIILFGIINYPLALPRFVTFSYLLFLVIMLFKVEFNRKIQLSLGMVAGVTTVFPILSWLTRKKEDGYLSLLSEYYRSSGDFDGFQSLINTVIFSSEKGLLFGEQLLSNILFFIPREIWALKSEPTGRLVSEYIGYGFTNISAPLPSEFYIDFGILGLVILGFLSGRLIRSIDLISLKLNDSIFQNHSGIFYAAVFGSSLMILMRGSLMAVVSNFILFLVIVYIATKMVFKRG